MFEQNPPFLSSTNGAVYRTPQCSRLFLKFDGAWMALTPDQLRVIGNTLGNILNCPFKAHHLESGMLLRSSRGDYRMPLSETSASELHALINDTLLLLEANEVAEAAERIENP